MMNIPAAFAQKKSIPLSPELVSLSACGLSQINFTASLSSFVAESTFSFLPKGLLMICEHLVVS